MSDPARDGYRCHGPLTPLIKGGDYGPLGLICLTCGVTKNTVRNDPTLRAQVDWILNYFAKLVYAYPEMFVTTRPTTPASSTPTSR